jgi:hypothetical protein
MPDTRATTLTPVVPSTRISLCDSSIDTYASRMLASSASSTMPCAVCVWARPIKSTIAVMLPGPAVSGMASGKMAISGCCLASISSGAVMEVRPV